MTISATPPAHPALAPDLSRVAQDLQIRKIHVENVVRLLDEQNTVPFITRYRKEMTGGLNEEVIRKIQHRVGQMRHLSDRKQTILKTIEGQGKLTDELRGAIYAADTPKRLEDLYLPYKPKKRSLASEAREKGLEPLALSIWSRDPAVSNLAELLPTMVNPEKQLNTPEDILAGAKNILAEIISELADLRGAVRQIVWDPSSQIVSVKNESLPEGKGNEYKGFFDFKESVQAIPPHRILAINRGEKEEALKVKLDYDLGRLRQAAAVAVPLEGHPHRELLETVVEDAIARLLLPSLEREVRRELTDFAQEHAVSVFARNLRSLLLQPPLRGKRLLGIDPGLRTGCKLAALDEHGNPLEHSVIYPHQPQNKKAAAKIELELLIRKHQLSVVAIGNGTACRETERLVSDLIAEFEARRTGKPVPTDAPAAQEPVAAGSPPPESTLVQESPPTTPPAAESVPAPEPTPIPEAAKSAEPPIAVTESAAAPENVQPSEPPPAAEVTASEVPAPTTEAPAAAETPAAQTDAVAPTEPVAPPSDAPSPAAETPPPAPAPPPPRPEPELPKVDLSIYPPPPEDLAYVIVNEAGASDYSASQVAREEFPDFDATLRGTISIGRRLQDPLSELVKIDPQHIGVGLYQHDMKTRNLKESLEGVVESCVNFVGVDLNSASAALLRHVSGLNALSAQNVVAHRNQNGPYKTREQLQHVPQLGPKSFEQAAGFLKIPGGDDPLDETWIHPENYPAARQILADIGFQPADLRDKEKLAQIREKLNTIHPEVYAEKFQTGMVTVRDIFDALARPSRDPREDLPPPIFRKGILKIEDLQPGMELKGTVLNVVDFGGFVDVGLKDSGLVHISQMANRYIKSPYEVVSVGDVVTVWVRAVDMERRHVALTMIQPGGERKPPERRDGPPRDQREPRQDGPRQDAPRRDPPRRDDAPRRDDGPRRDSGPRREGGPRPSGPPPRRDSGPARRQGPPPRRQGPPPPPPEPVAPPPPPRPRRPDKPLPKLTQSALKGQSPLHSFGELAAFFRAKEEPALPTPPPAVADAPTAPVAEEAKPPVPSEQPPQASVDVTPPS